MVIPKHILGTFDEALRDLRNDLLTMAGLTERSLYSAINGLLQRDDNPCTKAIADSRSHDAVIRVYDAAGKVIETHEHAGDFKEP